MAVDQNLDQCEKSESPKAEDERRLADPVGGRGLGMRHVQAAVMAAATFMGYSLRINLSISIVAMVRLENNQTTSVEELAPTFDWDEKTQGYLLSSFFWGYMILQIPAGVITEKYGGHRFLYSAILGSSILTILIPQCAFSGGWFLVCMNRMVQGICQGFLFPAVFTLLGVWCPPSERSKLASMALGAQLLGNVATAPISGYLVKIYGWPYVFYIFGGVGIVLSIAMIFLGADSPSKHRMISEAEKQYINLSLGGAKEKQSVPWKGVLTSAPYWAALLALSCYSLVYLMLLTKIPTYLATVLKYSIADNGLLTAAPYLVSYILTFVFSGACDFITDRHYVSRTTARKVFCSIAHSGSAVCIMFMAHASDRTMSVILLCAFMGCLSATFTGTHASFVDMSPNFSGSIFSIANFASAVLGLAGPVIVGFIVTETGSVEQWRIVFYLCAGVLVASNLVFIFLGTSKTQWWNWPDKYTCKNDLKESDAREYLEKNKFVPRLSVTY